MKVIIGRKDDVWEIKKHAENLGYNNRYGPWYQESNKMFDTIYEQYQLNVLRAITITYDNKKSIDLINRLILVNRVFSASRPLIEDEKSLELSYKISFRKDSILLNLDQVLSNHYDDEDLIRIIKVYYNVLEFGSNDDLLRPLLFKEISQFFKFTSRVKHWLLECRNILDAKQAYFWKIEKAMKLIEGEEPSKYLSRKEFAASLDISYDTLNRFIKEEGIRAEIPKGKLSPETQQMLKGQYNIWRVKK
jgi:hypothetical protein